MIILALFLCVTALGRLRSGIHYGESTSIVTTSSRDARDLPSEHFNNLGRGWLLQSGELCRLYVGGAAQYASFTLTSFASNVTVDGTTILKCHASLPLDIVLRPYWRQQCNEDNLDQILVSDLDANLATGVPCFFVCRNKQGQAVDCYDEGLFPIDSMSTTSLPTSPQTEKTTEDATNPMTNDSQETKSDAPFSVFDEIITGSTSFAAVGATTGVASFFCCSLNMGDLKKIVASSIEKIADEMEEEVEVDVEKDDNDGEWKVTKKETTVKNSFGS